jgi:hypothetical protein
MSIILSLSPLEQQEAIVEWLQKHRNLVLTVEQLVFQGHDLNDEATMMFDISQAFPPVKTPA